MRWTRRRLKCVLFRDGHFASYSGSAPLQHHYDDSYPHSTTESFFELDPSLPLPTQEQLDQAYAAYPLALPPQLPATTIFTWEEVTTAPALSSSASGSTSLQGVSVTGLVSRDEWLRLGGFEELGAGQNRREPEEQPLDHRRGASDLGSTAGHHVLPTPSLPPLPDLPPHAQIRLEAARTRCSTSSFSAFPRRSSRAVYVIPSSTQPRHLSHQSPEAPPSPSDSPSFSVSERPRVTLPPILEPKSSESRAKSHARRSSVGHIPRPRNAFILFRQHAVGTNLVSKGSAVASEDDPEAYDKGKRKGPTQQNVSQAVGAIWRALPVHERAHWDQMAEEEKRRHREMYPDYKYAPKPKSERRKVGAGKKAAPSRDVGVEEDLKVDDSLPVVKRRRVLSGSAGDAVAPPSPLAPPVAPLRSTFALPPARPTLQRKFRSGSLEAPSSIAITSTSPDSSASTTAASTVAEAIDPALISAGVPFKTTYPYSHAPHEYHFGAQDLFTAPETSLESLFGGKVAR